MRIFIIILILTVVVLTSSGWLVIPSEIEEPYQTALRENKEYTDQMAKIEQLKLKLQQQTKAFVKDKPEAAKIFSRLEELRNKADTSPPLGMVDLNRKLMIIRCDSVDCARTELQIETESLRLLHITCELELLSLDSRIMTHKRYMEKVNDDSYSHEMANMPRAEAKGTQAFKVAVLAVKNLSVDEKTNHDRLVIAKTVLDYILERRLEKVSEYLNFMRQELDLSLKLYEREAILNEIHIDQYRRFRKIQLMCNPDNSSMDKEYREKIKFLMSVKDADPEYQRIIKQHVELTKQKHAFREKFVETDQDPASIEYRELMTILPEDEKNHCERFMIWY